MDTGVDELSRLERVVCDLCGASESVEVLRSRDDSTYVRCCGCGLIYVNPRCFGAGLEEVYEDYAVGYSAEPGYDVYAITVFDEKVIRVERFVGGTGRLLDVGCGDGSFLAAARRRGWEVAGVEIARTHAARAHSEHGLDVFHGTLADASYAESSFDAITFWASLEHMSDPSANVRRAYELLRPGGVLAFSVPNWASLSVRLLGWRYRYLCRDHFFMFSPRTAREMLLRCGFEPLRITTDHFSPFVFWEDFRRPTQPAQSQVTQAAEIRAVQTARSRWYLTPLRYGWRAFHRTLLALSLGDNLVVYARKPCPKG